MIDEACADAGVMVEANDGSALLRLRGAAVSRRPLRQRLQRAHGGGARQGGVCNVCLPPEMPATAIPRFAGSGQARRLASKCRCSAASGWRCRRAAITRARTAGPRIAASSSATRTPTACRCARWRTGVPDRQRHPDHVARIPQPGRRTGRDAGHGRARFRLSPHSCDMVPVANVFRGVLDCRIEPAEAGPPQRAQARCAVLQRILPRQARPYLERRRPALTAAGT